MRSAQLSRKETLKCPTSPTPKRRGHWQGPVLGAGADYRALGGEQQEGRMEKPAALAAWRRDLVDWGFFFQVCLHLLMGCFVYGNDC